MTIERMFPSGGWMVSAMVDGQRVVRRYFDYTRREAIRLFRDEFGLDCTGWDLSRS